MHRHHQNAMDITSCSSDPQALGRRRRGHGHVNRGQIEKKYLVHPGVIEGRNDFDRHYITFYKLCELYGVDPRECVDASSSSSLAGCDREKLLDLWPDYNGHYKLLKPEEKINE